MGKLRITRGMDLKEVKAFIGKDKVEKEPWRVGVASTTAEGTIQRWRGKPQKSLYCGYIPLINNCHHIFHGCVVLLCIRAHSLAPFEDGDEEKDHSA